jgi:hypothetical protein
LVSFFLFESKNFIVYFFYENTKVTQKLTKLFLAVM